MSAVDWNSIGDQKSSGGNDDLVFLTAKNLPQTFLPSNEVVAYVNVFDSELNRSRPPKEGEKGRTSYLFYGLFIDDDGNKKVKICNCGQMAAKGIASVQKTVSNLGMLSFVKVTSTGSGLNTEYNDLAVEIFLVIGVVSPVNPALYSLLNATDLDNSGVLPSHRINSLSNKSSLSIKSPSNI